MVYGDEAEEIERLLDKPGKFCDENVGYEIEPLGVLALLKRDWGTTLDK